MNLPPLLLKIRYQYAIRLMADRVMVEKRITIRFKYMDNKLKYFAFIFMLLLLLCKSISCFGSAKYRIYLSG